MFQKPFKSLTIQRPTFINQNEAQTASDEPPLKKRRLSPEPVQRPENDPPERSSSRDSATPKAQQPIRSPDLPRKPLQQINKQPLPETISESGDHHHETYYTVVWRKITNKKHKSWDGDGVLIVRNGIGAMTDENGKEIGRTRCTGPMLPETMLSISGKEVQIEDIMRKEDYLAGRKSRAHPPKLSVTELDQKLRTKTNFNAQPKVPQGNTTVASKPAKLSQTLLPASRPTQSSFKSPVVDSTILEQVSSSQPAPRHDPKAPGAIVMKRPASFPRGKQVVDVVVDPILTKSLRDHQREGVKFMYECVMGMRPYSGDGTILADEMGLGKTLQVIALLWTLMKQNPIAGDGPVVKKALIVCPVTLIKNWRKEFRKWLGWERIGVFVVEDNKARLTDFTMGKAYNIMIIGYEKLRTVAADLQKGPGIDIVIADEGHRLKTAQNKSAQAIKAFSTTRRIILSGTPLQNDLSEFFFMVDFVNPGLLGKVNTFKKEFETPILKSRQPNASEQDIEKGEARSEELAELTSKFIIRRTAEILAKYLPQKTEYVLFCKPTDIQARIYKTVLSTPEFGAVLNSPETSLQLITILKKLCNSPSLLRGKAAADDNNDNKESTNSLIAAILNNIPSNLLKTTPAASGKFQVLDNLLHQIRSTTSEKVVIISHYTATLDILGALFSSLSYSYLRLDGSTPQSKRQQLVDRFNAADSDTCFAFLLSAKSGGVGLNLVGASRLILFDNDWNPSTDLQAMARIHRDGQKRSCRIYRLLTKGALDEKIFQRQATKLSLADSVVDGKGSASNFSREELRDLFRLDEREECQTHELLGCACGGTGTEVKKTDDQDQDPAEKVAAGLAAGEAAKNERKEEEEDEEEDLPSPGQIIRSSQYEALCKRAEIEEAKVRAARKEKEKGKMLALMQYRHFDTSIFKAGGRKVSEASKEGNGEDGYEDVDALRSTDGFPDGEEDTFDDEPLMNVLSDPDGRVAYVFAKTSS